MDNTRTFQQLLNESLHNYFLRNNEAILLGEDILDPYGGAFKVCKGLSDNFSGRILNTPISEAAIIGIGIGASLRGTTTIIEIMFGDFLTLGFDQILNHMSKFQFMYGEKINIPLLIRTPMGGYRGYGPTHSQSIEKHFLGISGVKIIAINIFFNPGDLLTKSLLFNAPIIFIENKSLYSFKLRKYDDLFINLTDDYFPIIKVKNHQNNLNDLLIVSYGGMSKFIENILIEMIDEEIWIESIIPCDITDTEIICNELIKTNTKKILFLEEGTQYFNWGSGIISELVQKSNDFTIKQISSKDFIIPTSVNAELEVLPSLINIKNKIWEMI